MKLDCGTSKLGIMCFLIARVQMHQQSHSNHGVEKLSAFNSTCISNNWALHSTSGKANGLVNVCWWVFSSQALQTFFMPFMWILIDLHMCSLLTQFTDILNINTLTARDVETSPIPHNRSTNQHTTGPARSLDSAFQRTEYPCGIVCSVLWWA